MFTHPPRYLFIITILHFKTLRFYNYFFKNHLLYSDIYLGGYIVPLAHPHEVAKPLAVCPCFIKTDNKFRIPHKIAFIEITCRFRAYIKIPSEKASLIRNDTLHDLMIIRLLFSLIFSELLFLAYCINPFVPRLSYTLSFHNYIPLTCEYLL